MCWALTHTGLVTLDSLTPTLAAISRRASSWQTIWADFDGVGLAFSHKGEESWFTLVVGVVAEPAVEPPLPQPATVTTAAARSANETTKDLRIAGHGTDREGGT